MPAAITVPNPDLYEDEDENLTEKEKEERRRKEELMDTLGNSVQKKFEERARRRIAKEGQWLRASKLFYGKLTLDNYYTKGETPFERGVYSDRPDVNVVRSKCKIAIAQTSSVQFGTSNKNWDLLPSKNDPNPLNIEACSGMSDEIETQLEECKYSLECRRAMEDRVIMGTGVMKGPLSTGKLVRAYSKIEGTDTWIPSVTVDYAPVIKRINPWFFYPDETTDEVGKVENTIETHPMSALELKKLMRHEGFIADQIEELLEEKPDEYYSSNWADFATLSENNPYLFKNKYLVLEYHGPITRTQLEALEIEPCYDSLNDEYYGEVWVCQGKVIRVELSEIEASYAVPYFISVWEKDPASVFGYGVPLMMEDAQRVVNETWHMILDNSSASSGPQVAMQKALIEPANGKWELAPGQIWYLTDMQARVEDAIQFFNIPNVTQNLVPIMQMAQVFAEEESTIPLISAGLSSPEVGDTATGQLMMHQASTTLLDFMSEEWDDNITSPIIEAMYAWNMQHNERPEIKGTFSVDVRTSSEYKNKQLHVRDLEKLSVESAQNPEMAKWINQGELSRIRIEMMTLPSKAIIKSAEQVKAEDEARAAQEGPAPEEMELQLKARRLALEEMQLEFEVNQQQQRELWDNEERMAANRARLVEAAARVAVSQNEKETEILKLAAKNEETAMRLMHQEKITRENNHTKAFLTGLQETRKQQEVDAYRQEIDLARNKGSGI